ncbi:hypothetical protein RA307_12905 [Xanthobacteraceae bacterium Astr-EGSB]|uniref:hypothetical protein n=1 Tax=Astrobacterium formosum TaxID=3069710 RepID=UPI0027B560DB|nr:hypothetical protein [Xanthobacteraceae bacterium Astr-EGSB]
MTELIVTCPNCRSEIALTEPPAAPIVQATRKDYEALLADAPAKVLRGTICPLLGGER